MGKNKKKNKGKAKSGLQDQEMEQEKQIKMPGKQEEQQEKATDSKEKKVICKHFPVSEEDSYVQYSIKMTEAEYQQLILGDGEANLNPGKNKMLLQCLDVSGSMYGRAMESLKEGCMQLGKRFFGGDVRAFEKFVTMTHHHIIEKEFQSENLEEYEKEIQKLHAHGGNNFLNVFKRIHEIIEENPNLEELEIIFVTDGHDTVDGWSGARANYHTAVENAIKQIQAEARLRSRYLTIGFSQNHNAQQMNQIASSGSDQGNFIYVDTQANDYPQQIAEALGDSFDIALACDSALKFRIENVQEDYKVVSIPDIDYVAAESAAN